MSLGEILPGALANFPPGGAPGRLSLLGARPLLRCKNALLGERELHVRQWRPVDPLTGWGRTGAVPAVETAAPSPAARVCSGGRAGGVTSIPAADPA